MAKISSYASDANVTISDRLIGSDNENSNETKNFQVGDIINLAASIIVPAGGFVPYTGATGNVDLGAYGLTTSYLTSTYGLFIDGGISLNGNEGNTGDVLVSQGPGGTPSWSNALSTYVPYTGATGNVNLGTYDLTADNHYGNIFQVNSLLAIYGGLQLNGSPGTAGHVLTSSGGGVPTWTSLAGFVPYTGATGNVNLGTNSLTADALFSGDVYTNNVFNKSGNPSVFIGNDAVAQVGLLINTSTNIFKLGDYNGNFNGTQITIDDNNSEITFVGGFNLSNGQGTSGKVLTSLGAGNTPQWTYPQDIVEFPFLFGYSDSTQVAAAANVGQAMTFNQTSQSFNMSINFDGSGNLSRITFSDSGIYNIQFSAQLRRTTGGSSQTVDIWFRKGGVDIPYSNTSVNVQANAGYLVASWNFFYEMDVTQPNPYIEIMWATTDTAIRLEQAISSAVHPATPSVILTVNKVSN